mgnify:CR=1 FL=1
MIILSPLLNQIEHIADFESLKFDILFTSGNQSRIPNNLGGGGLYRIKGRFDNYKLDKIIEKLDSTESLDQIIAELDVLKQKHYQPPAQELKSLVELIELNDMRFQKILEKLNPSELEKINSRRLKKLFDRLKIPVD